MKAILCAAAFSMIATFGDPNARAQTAPADPPPAPAPAGKPQAPPASQDSEAQNRIAELRSFTVRQRDQALERARITLELVDTRIHEWQARADSNWQRMDAASRDRARRTLDRLHEKRIDAATWYGGMRYSSAEAWGDVRTGFANSYRELAESMRQARAEFDRDVPASKREEKKPPAD